MPKTIKTRNKPKVDPYPVDGGDPIEDPDFIDQKHSDSDTDCESEGDAKMVEPVPVKELVVETRSSIDPTLIAERKAKFDSLLPDYVVCDDVFDEKQLKVLESYNTRDINGPIAWETGAKATEFHMFGRRRINREHAFYYHKTGDDDNVCNYGFKGMILNGKPSDKVKSHFLFIPTSQWLHVHDFFY
jgi:hypothetical protein